MNRACATAKISDNVTAPSTQTTPRTAAGTGSSNTAPTGVLACEISKAVGVAKAASGGRIQRL